MKSKVSILFAVMGGAVLICSCGDESSVDLDEKQDRVPGELFEASHVLHGRDWLIPTGSTSSTKETRSIIDASININVRDQKMSGKTTQIQERVYVSDYISNDSVRTEFRKDIITSRAVINGSPSPQPNQKGPLHQQTITFSKTGSQWRGELDGAQASPAQSERIEDLARLIGGYNNKMILGSIPRKVGESWDVKPSRLKAYAGGLEEMDGNFKVFFRSLVMHEGYACAEIIADFDLTGSELAGKEMRITGKVEMLQSLDYQIPLRMKMNGEIVMGNPIMNGIGTMRTKGPIELVRETILALP